MPPTWPTGPPADGRPWAPSRRLRASTSPRRVPPSRRAPSPSPASRGRSTPASRRSRSRSTSSLGRQPGSPPTQASTPGASGSTSGTPPPAATTCGCAPTTPRVRSSHLSRRRLPPTAPPGSTSSTSGWSETPRARADDGLGLDLDEQVGVDEGSHLHQGGGRSDAGEDLPVGPAHRLPVTDVGHVHPRTHDVGRGGFAGSKRLDDDLEGDARLRVRVARSDDASLADRRGAGHVDGVADAHRAGVAHDALPGAAGADRASHGARLVPAEVAPSDGYSGAAHPASGRGGTGRHAGFRFLCPRCAGSSPAVRTETCQRPPLPTTPRRWVRVVPIRCPQAHGPETGPRARDFVPAGPPSRPRRSTP